MQSILDFPEDILVEISGWLDRYELCKFRLSCMMIYRNARIEEIWVRKMDWKFMYNRTLSESFIEKYADKVDWRRLLGNQILSESFIEKYIHKLGP